MPIALCIEREKGHYLSYHIAVAEDGTVGIIERDEQTGKYRGAPLIVRDGKVYIENLKGGEKNLCVANQKPE